MKTLERWKVKKEDAVVLSGTECSILSGTGKDWSNTREMKGRRTREKLKERDRDVSAPSEDL